MKLDGETPETAPTDSGNRNNPKTNTAEPRQSLLERCFHILALSALGIAQPILDLLSRHHEFFVVRRFDRSEVVGLVVTLLIVIPAPFIAIEALLNRAPRLVGKAVHLAFMWFFGSVIALLFLRRAETLSATFVIGIAVLLAGAGTIVYERFRAARSFIGILAIGLVVIPAAFVLNPDVSRLLKQRQSIGLDLPPVSARAPIVFVVFDEFSLDVLLDAKFQINRHRYPNIAELADRSTWYRGAVTIADNTGAAVPAILTGVEPKAGHVPSLADFPQNLFTLFGGTYRLWVDESMTQLCPNELNSRSTVRQPWRDRVGDLATDLGIVYMHLILPREWGDRLPTISSAWSAFGASAAPAPPANGTKPAGFFFRRAIRSVRQDRRPGVDLFLRETSNPSASELFFVHLMLPHRPWNLLPDGTLYSTGGRRTSCLSREGWCSDKRLVAMGLQRYILQTMYVDTIIGRLVSGLEATDRFDETMIVLVADHGMGFTAGESARAVSERNAHEVLPVPLLIKAPGQAKGKVVGRQASTLDVLPTILDLLGEKPPWPMDGVSLVNGKGRKRSLLRVFSNKRGMVEMDPSVLKAKRRFVNNKLRLFGDGSNPESIYCFGRHAEICGYSTAELEVLEQTTLVAKLENEEAFRDVDLDVSALPAFLNGAVRLPRIDQPALDLAVALNGVVVAHTVSEPSGKRWQPFSVLLPPSAFQEGENIVEIYRITRRHDGLALLAIPTN